MLHGECFPSFLIDHILILIFGISSIFVFANPIAENSTFPSNGFYFIGAMMFLAYIFRDMIDGASLGKRFLGLKIVGSVDSNKPVSVGKLALRNLFIPLWPLEFLVLVFSSQNRRLGDMLAKTRVLYSKDSISKKFRLSVVAIVLVVLVIVFFLVSATVRETPSYKLVSDYVLSDSVLADGIGEIVSVGKYPSLSIKSNPTESISMISFKVSGQNGTRSVRGFLRKTGDSEWKVEKVEYLE